MSEPLTSKKEVWRHSIALMDQPRVDVVLASDYDAALAEIGRLTIELETRRLEAHQIYMASAKEIERLTVELAALGNPKAGVGYWVDECNKARAERDRLRAVLNNALALLKQAVRDTHFGLTEAEGLQWLKDTEAVLAGAAAFASPTPILVSSR